MLIIVKNLVLNKDILIIVKAKYSVLRIFNYKQLLPEHTLALQAACNGVNTGLFLVNL